MSKSYQGRSLIAFQREFSTEEACQKHFLSLRQKYLNEVCYRFNRRFWEKELFDRLVTACCSTDTVTYDQLVQGIFRVS